MIKKQKKQDWQVVGQASYCSVVTNDVWQGRPCRRAYILSCLEGRVDDKTVVIFHIGVPKTSKGGKNVTNLNAFDVMQNINCEPRSMDFTSNWLGVGTETALVSLIKEKKKKFS